MSRWQYLIPLVAILLLSMMLHEIAHGYVAYRLGDPTAKSRGRLTLNPLRHLDPIGTAMFVITYLAGGFIFGWAKPVPISPYYFRNRQKGMALVGVAGPLTNFVIAVIFWAILMLLRSTLIQPGSIRTAVGIILILAFQVNVVLGIFNLIPIPPLDGSRVLGGFLPRRAYEAWVSIDRYGMYIVIALLVIVAYSPLGDSLSRGYDALFRALLPGYF
ncbi:MAG: site-2 protease family protein [Actinobacteria bacterium]|nr:site-2 protease family protein [Actinomycetota bacterium]